MNRNRLFLTLTALLVLLLGAAGGASAQDGTSLSPQAVLGTAFTYQGRLTDTSGNPTTGPCDFQFYLYDVATGGTALASDLTHTNVSLTNGTFSVAIDFGAGRFDGQARWLGVAIRCPAGTGTYTTLTPRQALTAAPYAAYAPAAGSVPWSGLTGVPSGFADNTDNDTTYTAGTGLQLVGTAFEIDGNYRLPQYCVDGEILQYTTLGGWGCGTDNAGTYINGMGLTLSGNKFMVDFTTVQNKIINSCGVGSSIQYINEDGSVICETDDNDVYIAGLGLTLSSGKFNVDPTVFQRRLTASCGSGYAIRDIDQDGNVTCEWLAAAAGDITAVYNGTGLEGGGDTGDVTLSLVSSYQLPQGCAAGEVPEYNTGTSAWDCGTDDVGSGGGGGDITGVTAGTALTGGGSSGDVTLNVDLAGTGSASTVARSDHNHWGASWTGAGTGLTLSGGTTGLSGSGSMYGIAGQTSSTATNEAGVYGQSIATTGYVFGVYGTSASSNAGRGVGGWATASTGQTYGLWGRSDSTQGYGVNVWAAATTGQTYGVYALASSASGTGIYGTAPVTGTVGVAYNSSGTTFGVYGKANSVNGIGVGGRATATYGVNYGVWGASASTAGIGVNAWAYATTGFNYGIWGQSDSNQGMGVYGKAAATEGPTYGVYGEVYSPDGIAVYGMSRAVSGATTGVYGYAVSTSGIGVWGGDMASSGTTYGVYGRVASATGYGVYGIGPAYGVWGKASATNQSGIGVWGQTASTYGGFGVYGEATATTGYSSGVVGITHAPGFSESSVATGVYGGSYSTSASAYGVYGEAVGGYGVYGLSSSTNGVRGETVSTTAAGVYGTATSIGVEGYASGTTGHGVYGLASSTTGVNYGVYGSSSSSDGYGGFFTKTSLWGTTLMVEGGQYGNAIVVNSRAYTGNPKFRITDWGEVYADGDFNSGGADYAEMLPAVEGLQPGDLLAIGSDGKLTKTTTPYQASVVGVYSTQPGFVGGAGDDTDLTGKVPLAMMGVVQLKVSAENGAIQPGDLLTASGTAGHAMRAGANPPVGTVIGKALGTLDSGTGVILVLVMLQ